MKFNLSKEEGKLTGVYTITNLINGKKYIGSTANGFYNRYHQHKSDYKGGKWRCRVLYRAFKKYGIENFEFKILEACKKENVLIIEQKYLDLGCDYNICSIAGNLLGVKHPPHSKTRTVNKGKHHCAVPVTQYTLNGEKIKEFNSIVEAKEATGIKSTSNISQCCKGIVFSAGGYRWSFKNKFLVSRKQRTGRYVELLKNGQSFTFTSQKLAADFLCELGYNVRQSMVHYYSSKSKILFGYTIKRLS